MTNNQRVTRNLRTYDIVLADKENAHVGPASNPMGDLMPSHRIRDRVRKFFLCTGQAVTAELLERFPDSHIIGELRYVIDDGCMVTALARWEVSVSTQLSVPLKPDVDVYLIGDARDIKCRFVGCKNKEHWEIGQAAFMQLMSRYGRLTT